MKYTIVWNAGRSEGIILKDRKDIEFAASGDILEFSESTIGVSTLADSFRDAYELDDGTRFETQEIEI